MQGRKAADQPMNSSFPERLFAAGVSDLISVTVPNGAIRKGCTFAPTQMGKVPGRLYADGWSGFRGWEVYHATAADVAGWAEDGCNIGLLAAHFPGVDIDILDAALVEQVAQLTVSVLGLAPAREGRAPKRLLAYRLADGAKPFPKRTLSFKKEGQDQPHLIEILCDRQQYVVHGKHPSGADYRWIEDPTAAPLTPITSEDVDRLQTALVEMFTAQGFTLASSEAKARATDGPAPDPASLLAPSFALLAEVMAELPNTVEDHMEWRKWGMAIRAAAGPDVDGAFAIFNEWTSRWEGKYDGDRVVAEWRTMPPATHLGWPRIAAAAEKHGVQTPLFTAWQAEVRDPSDMFEADREPGPSVTDDGLRLAVLIGHEAAFRAEVRTCTNPRERWAAMKAVSLWAIGERTRHGSADPLDAAVDAVLPVARSCRSFASTPDLFRVHVLRGCPALKKLSSANQSLLLQVALASVDAHTPPATIRVLTARQPHDELVKSLIAAHSATGLIGAPKRGKSYLAVNLACAVAAGPIVDEMGLEHPRLFAGHPVLQHGPVVYFATEDEGGIQDRVAAWEKHSGASAKDLIVCGGSPNLSDTDSVVRSVQDLAGVLPQDGGAVRLVVVDVLRSATAGTDENDSGAMSMALTNAVLLGKLLDNAAVLLVHHSNKSNEGDPRGSSAFLGHVDALLTAKMRDKSARVVLTLAENKHGPSGEQSHWTFPSKDIPLLIPASKEAEEAKEAVFDAKVAYLHAAHTFLDALPGGMGQSAKALHDRLSAVHPEWFKPPADADGDEKEKYRMRRERALERAVEKKYLRVSGDGKTYRTGPVPPPLVPQWPRDAFEEGR